jgi:hypothetical protein
MIYFKNINLVKGFIDEVLVKKEKSSNVSGWVGLPVIIYLKNSSKEFHSIEEIIRELKIMNFLHEIIEFQEPCCSEPESKGFVLNNTQIQKLLSDT